MRDTDSTEGADWEYNRESTLTLENLCLAWRTVPLLDMVSIPLMFESWQDARMDYVWFALACALSAPILTIAILLPAYEWLERRLRKRPRDD